MAQGINLLIGADVSKAVSELQKLNGFVNNWSSQVRGAIVGAFSFYAVMDGMRQATRTFAEFEKEMSTLKALTGSTTKELAEMRDTAFSLSGALKAINIVRGETELSRLGFSKGEIKESIEAITDLSIATGTDLAKATEIAGSTLRSFGIDATQMQRVTDVMAASFNRTALDVTNFGEAIKYVAPNAAAANISLEETVAMLGTLANNGIKGSMAGTALRRIIQDLAGESGSLSEKFQKLNEKNITASYAFDEVGRIASTAFLILARGAKTTEDLTKGFHDVIGSTREMSKVMQDNLMTDWQKFLSMLDQAIAKQSALGATARAIIQFFTYLGLGASGGAGGKFQAGLAEQGLHKDLASGALSETYLRIIRDQALEAKMELLEVKNAAGQVVEVMSGGAKKYRSVLPGGWSVDADGNLVAPNKGEIALDANRSTTKEIVGLIPTLQAEIKRLGEEMEKTWDQTKIRDYATQIEKLKELIQKLKEPVKEIRKNLPKIELKTGEIPSIESMFLDVVDPGPGKGDGSKRPNMKAIQAALDAGRVVGQAFMNSFRRVLHGIGDVIATAFMGGNWQAALFDTLGNIAIELGGIIVAIGIGVESIKEALTNPFTAGPAAIAAGVALIGLGAAFKSAAAGLAGGGGGGGGGQSAMPRYADRDFSLNGEWRIRGSDLVYVLDKQGYRSSVVGG